MYTSAIRILAKWYMPNTLITPEKLKEILHEVRKTLWITNPDYDLVIDRLHLYYDMPLMTFGIDKDKNLIIQLPDFCTAIYTATPGAVSIRNSTCSYLRSKQQSAKSYMLLQPRKPYITLNSEKYIALRQQELRTCKRIGYAFYCEELFAVKHKTSYSCESTIYFNLDTDIIKENCDFKFYYNKTDIIPTVLDGGAEIILANWPDNEHIICNKNNYIPVKILSHPYVWANRSVFCNYGIEADNHYLLELLAACDNKISKLTMYFTINNVFTNYLDMFPNLTDSLQIPII